jgi:hypothetical protein
MRTAKLAKGHSAQPAAQPHGKRGMPAPFVWATESGSACASSAPVFGSGEWLLGLVLPDGPPGGEAFLPAFLLLFLPMLVCS